MNDARGALLSSRLLRFGAGSVVAVVCSQTTFLLLYGPLDASTTVSSVLAWLAGAVPNYWLNRTWTWQRRGRASLRHELLPYAAIVLGTLLVATLVTRATEHVLEGTSASDAVRTVVVTVSYFMVYAVMFVLRYQMFDRLFASPSREPEPARPRSSVQP